MTVTLGFAIRGFGGTIPLAYQYVPLLVSALLLGVPHGAVDHLVLPRSRGKPITRRSLAFVGGLYLLIGGGYAFVWFLSPALAFALFILVTLLHWGQGDVYALVELTDASHLSTRRIRASTALVRGGLPMVIPLVAFPEQYRFVAATLIGAFDPRAVGALDWVFTPEVRLAVAVGFGLLIATTLGAGYRRAVRTDGVRPWLIDAGETLSLFAYFGLVPPILAIGLYFPLWHSLRHILRTMLLDDVAASALSDRSTGRAFWRFTRDAAPLTAGAFIVLGAVALAVPETPTTVPDAVGVYLVFIAVLTLPHVVVVSLLDRQLDLWSPQRLSRSGT
ncbi:beta-carotene 15,15'-dioxygenase [Halalkaliarchaeum desulfuricum]|uniref:Probable beta-carotene 15,15'-dioxygenase n=1 Tax=Halalkaliarchaeum desulfuricum TaxID=2055893 RepID=A0A343TMT4_9EURY|nr:Brp/Blh family beta-carotene 15,15'-dioxygenase [Halalkaliarchaeum desulfuricum]AUX10406.1 beta-carotene 15,15'-dioxygenase [Halalkaliarchaeum desulfuricum]